MCVCVCACVRACVRPQEIVVGSNMDKIFIVMEYVEHDLKNLMESMAQPFRPGEVKTLTMQLLSAVNHLHDNWILHRDLKASNLLLSHKGILKVRPWNGVLLSRGDVGEIGVDMNDSNCKAAVLVHTHTCIYIQFVQLKE